MSADDTLRYCCCSTVVNYRPTSELPFGGCVHRTFGRSSSMHGLFSSGGQTASWPQASWSMQAAGTPTVHPSTVPAALAAGVRPHQPPGPLPWDPTHNMASSMGSMPSPMGPMPWSPVGMPRQPPPPPFWQAPHPWSSSTCSTTSSLPSHNGVSVGRLQNTTTGSSRLSAATRATTSLPSRKRRSPHDRREPACTPRKRPNTAVPSVAQHFSSPAVLAEQDDDDVECPSHEDIPDGSLLAEPGAELEEQPVTGADQTTGDEAPAFLQLEVCAGTEVLPWVWAGPEMADALGLRTHQTLSNKFPGGVKIVIPPDLDLMNSSDQSGVERPLHYDQHWQALKEYLIKKPQGWQPYPAGTEPAGAALEHNWRAHLYADWVSSAGPQGTWHSQSWKPRTKDKRRHLGATILYLLCRCVPVAMGGGFTFPFFTPARWKLVATVSQRRVCLNIDLCVCMFRAWALNRACSSCTLDSRRRLLWPRAGPLAPQAVSGISFLPTTPSLRWSAAAPPGYFCPPSATSALS